MTIEHLQLRHSKRIRCEIQNKMPGIVRKWINSVSSLDTSLHTLYDFHS